MTKRTSGASANSGKPSSSSRAPSKGGAKKARKPSGAPKAAPRKGARIIAIANPKGGVGKSTTAVSLGAALAEDGYRVLVIDLDPQGNASTGMGIRHEAREVTIYDVLVSDAPFEAAIVPTAVEGLSAIPSTIDLAGAEIELVSQFSRELKLRKALEPVQKGNLYDFVLFDCPPSLGLLTVNALAAARELIVPIQCEYYALEGLGQLLRNVRLVQQNINPDLQLTGIVMTMFDPRTKLSEQVVDEVKRYFGDRVYDVIIPRTVRLSEAPGFGQPITVYDPKSKGAECYRQLGREVATKPPPAEPMPSFDDLPTVVVPAIAQTPAPSTPVADEDLAQVPTVHDLVEEHEEELAARADAVPTLDPTPARLMEHPSGDAEEDEAAAWLEDLAADSPTSPSSSEVLAEVAAELELDEEDEIWDEGSSPAAAQPTPTVSPPHSPSRVVVIDDAAEDRFQAVASDPPPRTSGDDAGADSQPVARIGATLEEEGAPRKRWRLFRKGGE